MWNVVRKERDAGCPNFNKHAKLRSLRHVSNTEYSVGSHELTGIPGPRRNPCFGDD